MSASALALRLLLCLLRGLIHNLRHLIIQTLVYNICALYLIELVIMTLDHERVPHLDIINSVVVTDYNQSVDICIRALVAAGLGLP